MATKTKKATRKRPTLDMTNAIIGSCNDPKCEHEFCAPDHLEYVDHYSLQVKRSFSTHDGDYWEGVIYDGDSPIINVYNDGNGGPNMYHQVGEDYAVVKKYINDAKAAFPRLKWEPEEALTSFLDMCFQNFN